MRLTVDGQSVFVYTGNREHIHNQSAVVFIHGAGLDHTVWVLPSRYSVSYTHLRAHET